MAYIVSMAWCSGMARLDEMVNRCVWREKCLEYGGKKREVDRKLIVKKSGSVVLTTVW